MNHRLLAQIPLFPRQASTIAPEVDALYFFLLAVSGFFTILIATLILFFAIKYRRRPGNEVARQTHESLTLELTWTFIPLGLVLVMFSWGAWVYFDMTHPPPDAMEIQVLGKQWMWHLYHPNGQRENNELHVPVGKPVKLMMTSQDVIHNFSLPDFRIKQDVIPGRYTMLWFTPTQTGTFRIFCAEYCGTNHSQMIGWVHVMEPSKFEKWLTSAQVDGTLASKGRKLFLKLQCVTCHSANAKARAPLLENLFMQEVTLQDGRTVIADEDYLRKSILDPEADIVAGFQPIMPSYAVGQQINPEEMLQLLTFLKSLGPGQTPPRVEDSEPPATVTR